MLFRSVHPGSGSATKNWPEARWCELLEALASGSSLRFLLIGGEAEEGRLERLASRLPRERREILRSQPLPTEAERPLIDETFAVHGSDRQAAVEDLLWALLNTKEFLYNH